MTERKKSRKVKGLKRSKWLVKLHTVGYSYHFELWGKQWAFVKRWADVLAYVYPYSHLLLCFEKTTGQQGKKRGVLQMLTQSSKQEKTVACNGVSATEMMRIWLWVCSASRKLKHLEDLDVRWTSGNGEHGELYASQRKLCWKWFGKAGVTSLSLSPLPSFLPFLTYSPALLPFWDSSLYLLPRLFLFFPLQTSLQMSDIIPGDNTDRKQPLYL